MNRPTRVVLIVLGIIVGLGVLGYIAHSMNLVGMLLAMHTPPQHQSQSGSLTLASPGGSAITAAVVGLILNLAVQFGLHVLFRDVGTLGWGPMSMTWPVRASIDLVALALATVAALSLFALRLGMIATLPICGALGLAASLLPLAG